MKQKEIQILRDRIIGDAIRNMDSRAAMEYCCSVSSDGSWKDVDYASQAWANWPMGIHFRRIKEMACAYADKKSEYYGSEALRKAVCMATDFWMYRKWPNPNWWNREMLPGQEMRYTALFMGEAFGKERRAFTIGILQDVVEDSWTGANRVWFAENVMFKGILTENEKLICYAAEKIWSTVRRGWDELSASEDGIQPDGSFTQHGRLLYSNGYGIAWLDSVGFWIWQLRGLSCGAGKENYAAAVSMLLDGIAWMQRGGVIDPGTCGREISRKRSGTDMRMGRVAYRLLQTAQAENFPRIDELSAFEQYVKGKKSALPEGNRMFWRVDYMSHRRDGFTATVKMLSQGVKGSESILNENKLGGFLSYGMTVFMRHGLEYFGRGREDGIFSVMDWTHMPGVSAPAMELSAAETNKIDTVFAGGVTDGCNGAAVMDYEQTIDDVTGKINFGGKKAYFFFDEGAVMLGAGLYCDSEVYGFDTTLNQSRFAGVSCSDGLEETEVKTCRTGRWVNHDSTGYVFFEPVEYCMEQGVCTGAWERITDSYPEEHGNSTSQKVFKLYIRHGVNVKNKTYAYMVLPGQSESETLRTAGEPPVKIISNDRSLQAVSIQNQRITYLIFYEAGGCRIREGYSVWADHRCMLMVKESDDGVRVYGSCPGTPGLKLRIRVEYNGEEMERTAIFPEGGAFLGKTVEIL